MRINTIGLPALCVFVSVLTLIPAAQLAKAQGQAASMPSRAAAMQIEKLVRMPAGSQPLQSYARYYEFVELTRDNSALGAKAGDTVIAGTFVLADKPDHKPGIHPVPAGSAPQIFDGGCSVVNLLYNPRTQRMTEPFCNGDA